MTSTKDIATRRFRALISLVLFLSMTGLVLGQLPKNLDSQSKLNSVSCTFFVTPSGAKVWRQTGEGQRHFLGMAGDELHIGLNSAEADGKRDLIVEFSVQLWSGEWRSEKTYLRVADIAQSRRFPESGEFELPLTLGQRFQVFTKAYPWQSLVGVLLLVSGIVVAVKLSRKEPEDVTPRCGDYELLELLGRGGMGEVYAALDLDGNPCAVKKIRSELTAKPGFRELFDQEISTCLKLEHPNLVPIYAYGVTESGEVYLVSKRLTGETLKEKLASDNVDSPRLAAEVLEQIGGALTYLHSQNHVHCDVKPSNIFIDSDNKCWLMDLGVARSLSDASAEKTWGSPAYLSPEQDDGAPVFESDQYSLGVVLFEILTGQRPFPQKDKASLSFHHKNTQPPSPRELEPKLSEELEAGLLQMLAKEPSERHGDLDAVRVSMGDALFHL